MPSQNQIGDYKLIELAGEGSFGKVRQQRGCWPSWCRPACWLVTVPPTVWVQLLGVVPLVVQSLLCWH